MSFTVDRSENGTRVFDYTRGSGEPSVITVPNGSKFGDEQIVVAYHSVPKEWDGLDLLEVNGVEFLFVPR